jgi:hypothetical protein
LLSTLLPSGSERDDPSRLGSTRVLPGDEHESQKRRGRDPMHCFSPCLRAQRLGQPKRFDRSRDVSLWHSGMAIFAAMRRAASRVANVHGKAGANFPRPRTAARKFHSSTTPDAAR